MTARITALLTLGLIAGLSSCASTEEKSDAAPTSNATADESPPPPAGPPPDGKVAFDTTTLGVEPASAMSRGGAARIALEGAGSLQECYREALRADGALTLAVDLHVAVDAEGGASLTAVKGAEVPAALHQCMAAAISRWPYDWPKEPVVVTYPVTFQPGVS